MKRLDEMDIANMIAMRGLGQTQQVIADQLGVTRTSIQYHLRKLRKLSKKQGYLKVFLQHTYALNLHFVRRP